MAKSAYFMENGTSSPFYSANQEAFKGWMKKLESKNDNAPLDWIRNMTMRKPDSRLKPQQLMDRILTSEDEKDYYGLCCDGKEEDDVAVELRNSDIEDSSGSEGLRMPYLKNFCLLTTMRTDTSDDRTSAKKVPDSAVLEKQLCKAARAQDVKMLKRWLRKVPHLRNRRLNTHAIHHAAALGNEEIAGILVDFDCNLEFRYNGYTPLSTAIQASREGTTELLAGTKIAINAQHHEHLQSALHLAASRSFRIGMRILLAAGASVDIRDRSESTPLHAAAVRRDLLSVKLLLEHGATSSLSNSVGHSVLQLAAARGFDEIVQTLLDHGAEVDAVDASGKSPCPALAAAVSYNKSTTVRLLLQRGANVNNQITINGQILPSPLNLAAQKRLLQVAEILLQHKPNLELRDSQNRTPLIIACGLLDSSIAQRLLAAGADVKTADKSLDTLIMDLTRTKNFSILQLLIDNGASLKVRTPLLHGAAALGIVETIEFLLKNHMQVDAEDPQHLTPLMVAAQRGQEASVRVLVEHGASIDTRNHWGNTALHFAIVSSCTEVASLLLEYGSDPLLVTRDGYNALDIAKRNGREEIHGLISKALELAGRLVYDPRWPGMPFFLTLDEMHHGYKINDYNGRPLIKALPVGGQADKK